MPKLKKTLGKKTESFSYALHKSREMTPHRSSHAYSGTDVMNGAGWWTVWTELQSMLIMLGLGGSIAAEKRNRMPLAFRHLEVSRRAAPGRRPKLPIPPNPQLSPSTAPGIRRLERCIPLSPHRLGREIFAGPDSRQGGIFWAPQTLGLVFSPAERRTALGQSHTQCK